MSAVIPEALGNTHLVVLQRTSLEICCCEERLQTLYGSPSGEDCLHCSWAQTASDKIVGPRGASPAGRKSMAGENS